MAPVAGLSPREPTELISTLRRAGANPVPAAPATLPALTRRAEPPKEGKACLNTPANEQ